MSNLESGVIAAASLLSVRSAAAPGELGAAAKASSAAEGAGDAPLGRRTAISANRTGIAPCRWLDLL